MASTYLEAKPYEVAGESPDSRFLNTCLSSVSTRIAVEQQIMEIVGPLDAQQRWELLQEAHFPDLVRAHVYTGDKPFAVAFQLFETTMAIGYPATAYLLQLVGVENIQSEGFDADRVNKALNSLLQPEESVRDAFHRHDNSHIPPSGEQ